MVALKASPHHDRQLVRASLNGDEDAIGQMADRLECVPRIVGSINRRFGAPFSIPELDDVSQDVMVLVWKRRSSFEGRAKLETWIYRICYLEFLNEVRRLRRRSRFAGEALPTADLEAPPEPMNPQDLDVLDAFLQELGGTDEEVIRLKHYDGLTFKEIAEKSGNPSSSVKSRYYRGIAWLRFRFGAAS